MKNFFGSIFINRDELREAGIEYPIKVEYYKITNEIPSRQKLIFGIQVIKTEYKEKEFDIEWKYKSKIKSLEKENTHLHKIIDKFYETVDKFIAWICHKFGIGESKELVRNFEKETRTFINPVEQLKHEEIEKEWDLER